MTSTRTEAPFSRVARGRRGYDPDAVEAFLARARASFQGGSGELTSDDVRSASFPFARGGFEVRAVDVALSRLEEAFAAREREKRIADAGADTWVSAAREAAQELLERLARPRGERFDRVAWHRTGYSIAEVDAVATRVARYLSRGDHVTPEQLRSVAFHTQWRGYREEQVDAVLDDVVRVILAVR